MNHIKLEYCLITLLLLSTSLYSQESKRHIPLEGQANFRDIGGYKTTDGKTVKWNEIYRSGRLPDLTDQDLKKLEQLQLKTIVNFLTENEIKSGGKDRLPKNCVEKSLPIAGDGLTDELIEARKTGDFSKIPIELNPEIHRLLIEEAKQEYAALFRELLDKKNRPLVFHCSHGIHRTGTAAALILSALDVPWETIRKDYLLSNTYRAEEIKLRLQQLKEASAKTQGIPVDQVDMTNLNAFYILEGKYIDASLSELKKEYGSIKNYLTQGLGLTDKELDRLKSELLH